jgi:hypothetical protein
MSAYEFLMSGNKFDNPLLKLQGKIEEKEF